MPRDVHLVGSVPLGGGREVFETVSRTLGPRLKRIPDGETGERGDWITGWSRFSPTILRLRNRMKYSVYIMAPAPIRAIA